MAQQRISNNLLTDKWEEHYKTDEITQLAVKISLSFAKAVRASCNICKTSNIWKITDKIFYVPPNHSPRGSRERQGTA